MPICTAEREQCLLHWPIKHHCSAPSQVMLACAHRLCCRCSMALQERLPSGMPQVRGPVQSWGSLWWHTHVHLCCRRSHRCCAASILSRLPAMPCLACRPAAASSAPCAAPGWQWLTLFTLMPGWHPPSPRLALFVLSLCLPCSALVAPPFAGRTDEALQ